MSSIFRYLCLVSGAVLIAAGWFVISSESVQQELIETTGNLVASEVIAESSGKAVDPDDSHWSFLGPQMGSRASSLSTATNSNLLGVPVIVLGAELPGLAVPAGSFGGGAVPRGTGVRGRDGGIRGRHTGLDGLCGLAGACPHRECAKMTGGVIPVR